MHVLTLLTIVGDLEKIIYSICEKGTLYQLRNIINRRNVKTNPKDNVVAANDFLSIITTCHILAATLKLFQIEDLNAVPVDEHVDENTWMLPDMDRQEILMLQCHKVVDTYTDLVRFTKSSRAVS